MSKHKPHYHRDVDTGLYLPGDDPLERRRHGILYPDSRRWMSRRRCCCSLPSGRCNSCSDTGPTGAPRYISLTVNGIVGSPLPQCAVCAATLNGTFVLDSSVAPINRPLGASACYWSYSFPAPVTLCTFDQPATLQWIWGLLKVSASEWSTTLYLAFSSNVGAFVSWKSLSSAPDCHGFSAFDIGAYTSGGSYCPTQGPSTTATITSL